MTVFLAAF